MATKNLVPTRHSGIWRREPAGTYTYTYRDHLGRQKYGTERTLSEAVKAKARRMNDRGRGPAKLGAVEYLKEWVERHPTVSELTREEYRRDLDRHIVPLLGSRATLADLTPLAMNRLVAELARRPNGRGGKLSPRSIEKLLAVLSGGLRSATQEGLIPTNPLVGVKKPRKRRVDPREKVRVLQEEQLRELLAVADPHWTPIFHLCTAAGLRFSELAGLDVRDVQDDQLHVHQRWRDRQLDEVKSDHSVRTVPLTGEALAFALERAKGRVGRAPLLETTRGTRLDYHSSLRNFLKPAMAEVGASWGAWHTLRHTAASMLFSRGENIVAVSQFLGHSRPSFTLNTYVHLLERDRARPLDISLRGDGPDLRVIA